ncbi:MAG TPA: dienelactone hydrolase family protein [Allosphingosinicella sp.]|jgi:dienelactone hydrolase|nr:dienelactone hydrolase family protein [Allosphingosinicella sp.]
MELQPLAYETEGRTFTGYLADGSGGRSAPGALVVHEGGGLTAHAKSRAAMLAELGFIAYAMDLFGLPEFELEQAKAIVADLRGNVAKLRGRCAAALDVLRAQPNVDGSKLAAIGFCFGGTAVLELARGGAELAAVVGFHAGLVTSSPPEDNGHIRGKVLVCLGAEDPVVTAEHRRDFVAAMAGAGVDWQLHLYGGVGHSFTNREIDAWDIAGFAYDETADRRSWAAMRALFSEVFP